MYAACNPTRIRYICTSFMTHERRWYGCVDCGAFFEVAEHTMLSPELAYKVVLYPTQDTGERLKEFTASLPALRAQLLAKPDVQPYLADPQASNVTSPVGKRRQMNACDHRELHPGRFDISPAYGSAYSYCRTCGHQVSIEVSYRVPGNTVEQDQEALRKADEADETRDGTGA